MSYFSEREEGERPRIDEIIRDVAWRGLQVLVRSRVDDGSFGATYPAACQEGRGTFGTNEYGFERAIAAEIPGLPGRAWDDTFGSPPRTLDILDMIEFCWRCIGKPSERDFHEFLGHYHLSFDVEAGRAEFAEAVNRILRRNGVAYTLTSTGKIERLLPPVLHEALISSHVLTPDAELNRLLLTASYKLLDPDIVVRRESLEALWDAWERLKTLGAGADKKAQASALLNLTAGQKSPKFREALEREAREMTWIGNNLQIRHTEVTQERLAQSAQVDYMFHRLYALVLLILRMNGWAQV